MSDIKEIAPPGIVIGKKFIPFLIAVIALVVLCVGVVGIFSGSNLAERRWQKEKLNYEQRLGTESAKAAQQSRDYQNNFNVLAQGLKQTQSDVNELGRKFDLATAKRDKASAQAIAASREASERATDASRRAAALGQQLQAQQSLIVAKTDEAANAAKATEKKLDTAVRPTAAVPPRPWSAPGGH